MIGQETSASDRAGAGGVMAKTGDHPLSQNTECRSIDVFLIGGQSNAEGYGERRGPGVPHGMAFQYFDGRFVTGNDPVGTANTGSAWPAFMQTYVNKTGRHVIVVPTAVGGTSQCSKVLESRGTWDEEGELWNRSIERLQEAFSAIRDGGFEPLFRGVLWCQGESDASAILQGVETAADYEAALCRMIGRYRKRFPRIPFYIFRTGAIASEPDFLAPIREAQERVAAADPLSPIVFRGTADFPVLGLMRAGEHALHYAQGGLDLMGARGAEAVIAHQHVYVK